MGHEPNCIQWICDPSFGQRERSQWGNPSEITRQRNFTPNAFPRTNMRLSVGDGGAGSRSVNSLGGGGGGEGACLGVIGSEDFSMSESHRFPRPIRVSRVANFFPCSSTFFFMSLQGVLAVLAEAPASRVFNTKSLPSVSSLDIRVRSFLMLS